MAGALRRRGFHGSGPRSRDAAWAASPWSGQPPRPGQRCRRAGRARRGGPAGPWRRASHARSARTDAASWRSAGPRPAPAPSPGGLPGAARRRGTGRWDRRRRSRHRGSSEGISNGPVSPPPPPQPFPRREPPRAAERRFTCPGGDGARGSGPARPCPLPWAHRPARAGSLRQRTASPADCRRFPGMPTGFIGGSPGDAGLRRA